MSQSTHKNSRPSKLQVLMDVADACKQRSHDAETKVGAVLVNNVTGAIVATGFNGFVRGASDKNLPCTRPEKYDYIVHAEENLVANCAYGGISMKDCTLVCTLSPCVKCMRLLFQCGITTVIAKEKYKGFSELQQMKDIHIEVLPTEEGFLELRYKT